MISNDESQALKQYVAQAKNFLLCLQCVLFDTSYGGLCLYYPLMCT